MIDLDFNGSNFRVFASIAEIDTWVAADITRASAWASRSNELKAQAAIAATRFLSALRWKGTPVGEDAWPRENVRDVGDDETPIGVLEAFFILSADVATTPNLFEEFYVTSTSGVRGPITRVRAGSAEVSFANVATASASSSSPSKPNPTPDNVYPLVRPFLRTGNGVSVGAFVSGTQECETCDDFEKNF